LKNIAIAAAVVAVLGAVAFVAWRRYRARASSTENVGDFAAQVDRVLGDRMRELLGAIPVPVPRLGGAAPQSGFHTIDPSSQVRNAFPRNPAPLALPTNPLLSSGARADFSGFLVE